MQIYKYLGMFQELLNFRVGIQSKNIRSFIRIIKKHIENEEKHILFECYSPTRAHIAVVKVKMNTRNFNLAKYILFIVILFTSIPNISPKKWFTGQTPRRNYNDHGEEELRVDNRLKVYARCMQPKEFEERGMWRSRRIFNSDISTISEVPFLVSIMLMKRFHCAGSLYASDLVITSASCLQLLHNNRFYRENPRILKVRVGSNHSRYGGEVVLGTEVFFHPSYDPVTLNYNVAVIRLLEPVISTDFTVMTPRCILLWTEKNPIPSNVKVQILGFGDNIVNSAYALQTGYIQSQMLPIYTNYFCKERYGKPFAPDSTFCAGTISTGEGACNHDSGGPAILDGKLVGIISTGPEHCGDVNSPVVFTHVGHVYEWIDRVSYTKPMFQPSETMTCADWNCKDSDELDGELSSMETSQSTPDNVGTTPPLTTQP